MTAPQPVNNPSIVWTRFLVAFARLLALPMRAEAAFRGEAFINWQNNLLNELGSPQATDAVASALQGLLNREESRVAARLMLDELDGFTIYVERLTGVPIDPDATYPETLTTTYPPVYDPNAAKEGLSVGKILIDSLTDLLRDLPFGLRAALKALSELAGIAGIHR